MKLEKDMELEQQVVSLELAKKLKELGVKQESLFVWVQDVAGPSYVCRMPKDGVASQCFLKSEHNYPTLYKNYSAFTVAELGRKLTKTSPVSFYLAYMETMGLATEHFDTVQAMVNVMTDPDIVASMLIYLIENNLLNK